MLVAEVVGISSSTPGSEDVGVNLTSQFNTTSGTVSVTGGFDMPSGAEAMKVMTYGGIAVGGVSLIYTGINGIFSTMQAYYDNKAPVVEEQQKAVKALDEMGRQQEITSYQISKSFEAFQRLCEQTITLIG